MRLAVFLFFFFVCSACNTTGSSSGYESHPSVAAPDSHEEKSEEIAQDTPTDHSSCTFDMSKDYPPPAENPRQALFDGVVAAEQDRWGEAIAHFQSALAASPTWAAAHMEMAYALLMTEGDPGLIGQHLANAYLLERDNPRVHYLEGMLSEERQQPKIAAAAYERAVEIRPSMVDARIRLGRLLLQEGYVEDAIHHLEAAVTLDPSPLPARANLSSAYEQAGRIEDAANQLESIANLYPDNAFHLHRLAALYERHGRQSDAHRAIRRAEAIEPSNDSRRLRPLLPSRR